MVKVREDLTDRTFGKLKVIEQAEDYIDSKGNHRSQWLCECECGNIIKVLGVYLKSRNTKSCGCMRKETIHKKLKKYNRYEFVDDYVIGYTSKGEQFYFDLKDYDKVKDICWWRRKDGYITGHLYADNKDKLVLLHQLILDFPDMVIDHICGKHTRNDNRRSNLRKCTTSQNAMNKNEIINNTSGCIGVTWDKNNQKWQAEICANRKRIRLGRFKNFDDAVKARKEAEEKYFGEYSYDNSQKIGGHNEVSTDRN